MHAFHVREHGSNETAFADNFNWCKIADKLEYIF